MKRRRMLLAVIAGTPLLLVLVAITIPPLLVDSEHFRGKVIALVKLHTGRNLHIDGEMRLRLLPDALFNVTDVRLANPPGLAGAAFADLAELEAELNLMPLLAGRVEMNRLVVRGLTLNLERDESGRGNWEGLVRADDGTGAAIGAMALRGATITWRDPMTGAVTPIADIDVEFAALHPGVRIDDVRVRATLVGAASRDEAATIDARGDIELTHGSAGFLVPKLVATITGLDLAGARVDATLDTRLAADFTRERLNFNDLHLSAQASVGEDAHATLAMSTDLDFDLARSRLIPGDVTLKIPAYSVSGLAGELDLSGVLAGDLQAGTYALTAVHSQGSVGDDDDTGERVPFRFNGDLELSAGGRVLTAKHLQLALDDKRATGTFELRAIRAPPGVAGHFDLVVEDQALNGDFAVTESSTGHNLRLDLIADLDFDGDHYSLRGRNAFTLSAGIRRGPQAQSYRISDLLVKADLAHPAEPGSADDRLAVDLQADVDVDLKNEALRSDNLRLALDESRIAGSVDVRRFDAPTVRFDLQADTIDADRLLPPLPASAKKQTQTTPLGATIEAIRALNLNGEMRIDRMTLRGLELENVRLRSVSGVKGG